MSKSLSTLQTIAKVAAIVCKVIFILCIVGAVGSLVGLLALAILGPSLVGGNGHQFVDEVALMSGILGCITGMIICAGEAVLARMGERYFMHEQEAGTPFTKDGAKEIFRLGIASLIVSVATSTACGIAFGIVWIFEPSIGATDAPSAISIGVGLVCLLLSVIFAHGAELREQNQTPPTEEAPIWEPTRKKETAETEPTADMPTPEASPEDGEQASTQSFDVL